jgi:tubulin polyglutamylase TTLL2
MKIFLFREGIVRFSSERYDTSTLSNVYSHLTNSSINKYAHQGANFSGGGNSFKWTFEQL